ncbi:MAG: bifunctional 3-deoxy-7-phosphoheptulonate synthase/chorismate mutase [Candidatus Eremiobacteraeota bacterium]|nr:bifunctional 3-deoxy-7-phosphoheptulonate synthase/chorismate mutase [Candidatus Eremiobacteraeota bacterium]
MKKIDELRKQIDELNFQILDLLSKRARVVGEIGRIKSKKGHEIFDPARESTMLKRILEKNPGPFPDEILVKLFKEIFKASMLFMKEEEKEKLKVSRKYKKEDTIVEIGDVKIGAGHPYIIAGPCSVESYEQLDETAAFLSKLGIKILRGGAFKPRTSPYSFQGLREKGLEILKEIKNKYGMLIITEVMASHDVEKVSEVADILQIGARNMYHYELLKEVGRTNKPVFLKRSFMATLEEFLYSAEYIITRGNTNIILCERGIRTFERWTRNTLDISAIPILKKESHLPVTVDVSHSTGRTDLASWVGRAAIAAGADGVMVEVHPNPAVALSDGDQQLNFQQFNEFLEAISKA